MLECPDFIYVCEAIMWTHVATLLCYLRFFFVAKNFKIKTWKYRCLTPPEKLYKSKFII